MLTDNLERILETTIPIIIFLWDQKRRAKKENQERFENLRVENAQRHQENKNRLEALMSEREYLQPHDHVETEGNLLAEGIIRKKHSR